ncbi:MAG: hypothetical protein LH614_08475 [Pyrinomonadaceae bacterium]|nr:hypothetical protein [Pyrinomonadaceae bacterium]
MLKQRIAGLFIALVSIGIFCLTWYELRRNGTVYLKAATFAPVGIVGGIFLVFFPQFYGKPETTAAKAVTLAVFVVGLLFGLGNLYLIDPQMFKF